jgi:RNA polymerase sigma-70 factor (ECF subfamily)
MLSVRRQDGVGVTISVVIRRLGTDMIRIPRLAADDASVSPSDTDVAQRCQLWYGAYGHAVYRFIRFHLDSADAADDLTAEVFLRVLEAGEDYDPARGEARAWVFRIARNAVWDLLRQQRVRRQVTWGELRDVAADAPSPEERLLRQEETSRLLDGVQRLNRTDRELIGLRYGSELTPQEIAETLGLREGTVRTRLSRALARLRTALNRADQ